MTTKHSFHTLPPRSFAFFSKLLGMCFVVLFSLSAKAQSSTVYTQPFSGTLLASGWTVTNLAAPWGNGSTFGISNIWQVSDSESGMSANTCGTAGVGDGSLYMGATAFASGAAYLSDVNTNRRISSPNINTTGYTNVVAEFDFIGGGEGTTDRAYFVYSINGGSTWIIPTGAPTSANPAMGTGGDINNLKSQLCGAQGLWTHITWNMPVSCAGITTLRVGFTWQSNNNSLGSDPSFATDDVTINAVLTPTPIELISFEAKYTSEKKVALNWITATEINNDYFTVERSTDAISFSEITQVTGAGNSSQLLSYTTLDHYPFPGISYYRLKQTDYNGDFTYSSIEMVDISAPELELVNCYCSSGLLELTLNCPADISIHIELYSVEGKRVFLGDEKADKGQQKIVVPVQDLPKGLYLLNIAAQGKLIVRKIVL